MVSFQKQGPDDHAKCLSFWVGWVAARETGILWWRVGHLVTVMGTARVVWPLIISPRKRGQGLDRLVCWVDWDGSAEPWIWIAFFFPTSHPDS